MKFEIRSAILMKSVHKAAAKVLLVNFTICTLQTNLTRTHTCRMNIYYLDVQCTQVFFMKNIKGQFCGK